jgi:hypothetical protein
MSESSRLPQDLEEERIIDDVRRRKEANQLGREQGGVGGTTGEGRSSMFLEDYTPQRRRKGKTPERDRMRLRSRSPTPIKGRLRSGSMSPPPRASAGIETARAYRRRRSRSMSPMRGQQIGYNVELPVGGPISESPSPSPTTSTTTSSSESSPTFTRESKTSRILHPLATRKGRVKEPKRKPGGLHIIDLSTRMARVGKHGESVHFISFGTLSVRLIRGKNLQTNGINTVYFFLPTPSMKKHGHYFGVSSEAKRIGYYNWDETFRTPVELETKENALEVVRNLVVTLHYSSPHLHRSLGDMEGTVDLSEMIRSAMPLHSFVKLPLYPSSDHKKRRERTIEDRHRPTLYLEILWKPSEAFSHSFLSLMDEYDGCMDGIKTRNFRLNLSGFSPFGCSYGLLWLQNVAQSWIYSMSDAIEVINVSGCVQPGPFTMRGRSDLWEAATTVWFRINEARLRALARNETQVLERRERELEEKVRRNRKKYGTSTGGGAGVGATGVGGGGGFTEPPTVVEKRGKERQQFLEREREGMGMQGGGGVGGGESPQMERNRGRDLEPGGSETQASTSASRY